MVLFRNINKACNDLLCRDFVHDKPWEIDFKHTGRNPVLTQNASLSPSGTFAAASSLRHVGPWGYIDTKFSTGSITADATFKSPYLAGLVLGGRIEHKNDTTTAKGSKDIVDVSMEFSGSDTPSYVGDGLRVLAPHLRFNINPLLLNWTTSATTGIALGPESTARIGAEMSGSHDMQNISYSVGGSFSQCSKDKSWTVALTGSPYENRPFGKLLGSIHCKSNFSGAAEVGAEVSHYPQAVRTDVAFVGLWYLNQPVGGGRTDTIFKLKLTHDAKALASLSHKLSDSLTATIGAQIDATKPDAAKYGMRLNVTA